jgi:type IV pilus assembly protein PilQ
MRVLPRLGVIWLLCLSMYAMGQEQERSMSLDLKDTDIRDAIRMISKAYSLNIILDNDVSGTVTLHLSDVPIMEGLRSLAESRDLELVREGSLIRIRKRSDEAHASIRYSRGKLTIDVQNVEAMEFIEELSSKTGASIVPDSKLSGKITGKLFDVELDDGIRAILEGNGFKVMRRRNIYYVSDQDDVGTPRAAGRGRRAAGGVSSDFFVDYAKGKLSIEVTNGNLEDVLKAISDQSDVEIVTYGNVRAEVNAKLFDQSLTDAFALLLGGTQYTFVEKDGIVLIGDRNSATPAGQALSKSELLPLKHIKADEVPQVLPKSISANNVKVIKEQNALMVTGTSEDIVQMREFLRTIDIPTPQVRIDAVIVEYKESLNREFGFRFWGKHNNRNNDAYALVPGDAVQGQAEQEWFEFGTSGKSIKDFLKIGGGLLGKIPDNFYMVLRWLEAEEKAKILAQPSVLTLNGRKASINVDETQYFKVTTGDSSRGEYYSARIQPIKFGISLDITPWISQSGQITTEIVPQVSNSDGQRDGFPNVSTRALNTTVRLHDGETVALGGLVKHNEGVAHTKVPFLGDIPILGYLFRTNSKTKTKTNLVIYITPTLISRDNAIDLRAELRDYDLYMLGTIERKALVKLRELRARRRVREAERRSSSAGESSGPIRSSSSAVVVEERDLDPDGLVPVSTRDSLEAQRTTGGSSSEE